MSFGSFQKEAVGGVESFKPLSVSAFRRLFEDVPSSPRSDSAHSRAAGNSDGG